MKKTVNKDDYEWRSYTSKIAKNLHWIT